MNPTGSPASTDARSAVFFTDNDGFSQVTLAESCASGAFDALAVAVLSYVVHAAYDVCAVTCTLKLAPDARSTGEHDNVPDEIEH